MSTTGDIGKCKVLFFIHIVWYGSVAYVDAAAMFVNEPFVVLTIVVLARLLRSTDGILFTLARRIRHFALTVWYRLFATVTHSAQSHERRRRMRELSLMYQ